MSGSPLLIVSMLPTLRTWHTQLRRETEALGRKAAQLRGSNQGLQTKLEAQREELTGRVRSATSITMQVGAQQCRLCHEIIIAMPRRSEVQPPRWEWHMQMACSDQKQSDMYPLVLGAVLEACCNNVMVERRPGRLCRRRGSSGRRRRRRWSKSAPSTCRLGHNNAAFAIDDCICCCSVRHGCARALWLCVGDMVTPAPCQGHPY